MFHARVMYESNPRVPMPPLGHLTFFFWSNSPPFCAHSDHLGSRYELSAFGTLQSSVSRQEEVQEHESVHSKFCNSRVFSEGSLPSGFSYWQRSKSFVNVPSFVRRNLSIFDLLARFVCSWTTQRGRIQEVVARVASRGVVPCYWYFNTL